MTCLENLLIQEGHLTNKKEVLLHTLDEVTAQICSHWFYGRKKENKKRIYCYDYNSPFNDFILIEKNNLSLLFLFSFYVLVEIIRSCSESSPAAKREYNCNRFYLRRFVKIHQCGYCTTVHYTFFGVIAFKMKCHCLMQICK